MMDRHSVGVILEKEEHSFLLRIAAEKSLAASKRVTISSLVREALIKQYNINKPLDEVKTATVESLKEINK